MCKLEIRKVPQRLIVLVGEGVNWLNRCRAEGKKQGVMWKAPFLELGKKWEAETGSHCLTLWCILSG